MVSRRTETPPETRETPADRAAALARAEGEAVRLAWLATLDPRDRERLALPGE